MYLKMGNSIRYNSFIVNTAIFNATFNQQMLRFLIKFAIKQDDPQRKKN